MPTLTVMDVDILLAYIALGSPVGVYLLLRADRKELNVRSASKTFIAFALWPIALGLLIYQRRSNFADASAFETRDRSDSRITRGANILRGSIEESLGGLEDRRFAVRKELFDAIDRFVGLRLASSERLPAHAAAAEIYTVAGHPNPSLATICLARKNSERIAMHAVRAAADLKETIDLRAPTVADAPELIEFLSDANPREPQQATSPDAAVITPRR